MTEFYVISGKTYLTLRGMIKVLAELSTGLEEAPASPAPWDMVKATFDLEAAEAEIVRLKEALQLENNYWHGSWERTQDAALKAMAERDALRNELAELRERQDYIPPAVAEELKAAYAQVDKLRTMESTAHAEAFSAKARLRKLIPLAEAAEAYAHTVPGSPEERTAEKSLQLISLDLYTGEEAKP